jgi:alpha-glucosidase (family GH31 glycosyl hydrolase)
MFQGKDPSQFFGMYFHNSNAQVAMITHEGNEATFTYVTTGGIIEAYFFTHGSPQFILQQYHELIGKPHLPPFWTMGFQQGSWTYDTQAKLQAVVDGYKTAGIPLEAIWVDIPYMNKFADFSVDTTNFPNLKKFADDLHAANQKVIPILDAGLSADNLDDVYYKSAQTKKALIQSTVNPDKFQGALTAKVWPTATVFLDFFKSDAKVIWKQGLTDLFAKFEFDGLWLDMNEPTLFCDGECPTWPIVPGPTPGVPGPTCVIPAEAGQQWYCSWQDQSKESTYFLPFVPGASNAANFKWVSLDKSSLSLNATHTDDVNKATYTEYNVHNLFGLMQQQASFDFMTDKNKRPFLLSRATFASSGKYSSHWLGDNYRTYEFMKYSVAGIFNMNMFGVPHAGADVCGFFGNKDDEMCGRWTQLATFYPFARNHYNLTNCVGVAEGTPCPPATPSEPYTLSARYKTMATNAIFDRLSGARFIYTQLAKVHKKGGSMFSPLFYYYPTETMAYQFIESTIMIGDYLKITPVMEAGSPANLYSFFPKDIWVNFFKWSEIVDTRNSPTAQFELLLTSDEHVMTHIRGGSIVPWQMNKDRKMVTTADFLKTGKVSLIALLNSQGTA